MENKESENKLNIETVENTKNCVYFFVKRENKQIHNSDLNVKAHLIRKKPIKYSTVFVVNKDNLKVSDEDIEIPKVNIAVTTLKNAKEKVKEQKSNRSKWFNIMFFIINIIVLIGVLIYQSNTFGVASLDAFKENARLSILFYTCLLFVLIMIFESLRTFVLIYKGTRRARPFLSYKASAILRYYDCITPFATGGQPFEIFYLNSRGVHSGIATAIPFTKAIFNNLAFTIISVIVLICSSNYFQADQNIIITWSIISLTISCLILVVLLLFAISKKIMPKILMFFLKLGHKMHLVKDYRVTFTKLMRTILVYQKSSKYFITNFWITLTQILCSGAIVIIKALIPFMLYWAFHEKIEPNVMLEIFSKFILVELATKYIPIPGGTGVAEISFSALFASLFNDGTLFWAMLFWRILNYFIYLLQGIIVIIYDFVYGNKKNKLYKLRMAKKDQEILEKTKNIKVNK